MVFLVVVATIMVVVVAVVLAVVEMVVGFSKISAICVVGKVSEKSFI